MVTIIRRFMPKLFKSKPKPLEAIIGTSYLGEVVVLDEHHYVNCSFLGVTLVWNGGRFQLDSCTFTGVTRIESSNQLIVDAIFLLKGLGALEQSFAESWRRLPETKV